MCCCSVWVWVLLGVGIPGLKSFKALVSRDTVVWWLQRMELLGRGEAGECGFGGVWVGGWVGIEGEVGHWGWYCVPRGAGRPGEIGGCPWRQLIDG